MTLVYRIIVENAPKTITDVLTRNEKYIIYLIYNISYQSHTFFLYQQLDKNKGIFNVKSEDRRMSQFFLLPIRNDFETENSLYSDSILSIS